MKRLTYVAAVALVVLLPIPVLAVGTFSDVDDSNVFTDDIDWLAAAGVTVGCNPPANDQFCPEAVVTRQQMAAFMHRLAANKIVDAATAEDADALDGLDSSAFLQRDEKAGDSDLLDGLDSTEFLLSSELAADSDLLDGLDSTHFAAAADVYTKDEINASPEAWLRAGGQVNNSGTLPATILNWGGTLVSRTDVGVYKLVLEGLAQGCAGSFPLPILTGRSGIATVSGMTLDCATGDATITVHTHDYTGVLADQHFTFLVYTDNDPDLSADAVNIMGYTTCELDLDSGEKLCS